MIKALALGAVALAISAGSAYAAGDAAAGETVFKKCLACHAIGPGAVNKIGPQLNDVVGRTAGTAADYKYSDALTKAGQGGLVWTPDKLELWLKKPRDFVPGTKMTFAGIDDPAQVDNVIAYLQTFSPNYKP
jgi:cytochrome c